MAQLGKERSSTQSTAQHDRYCRSNTSSAVTAVEKQRAQAIHKYFKKQKININKKNVDDIDDGVQRD